MTLCRVMTSSCSSEFRKKSHSRHSLLVGTLAGTRGCTCSIGALNFFFFGHVQPQREGYDEPEPSGPPDSTRLCTTSVGQLSPGDKESIYHEQKLTFKEIS